MNQSKIALDQTALTQAVMEAAASGRITPSAAQNIERWLTDPVYQEYAPQVAQHIERGDWATLDDLFWTVIPFGTGGRRGRMYPIGCNAINDRTIGESAQGLASYVRRVKPEGPWSCAIAYDTRHRSREFAELCAAIMVANGFQVHFLDDYRSTPQLSFLVRYRQCDCGIMVTASHNPPTDNAVKVYWSGGVQLVPPHDQQVIEEVGRVREIPQADFQTAVDEGDIEICTAEVDAALLEVQKELGFGGPRDLKVIFSPLHGVGEGMIKSLLEAVGFNQVEIFEPHRLPSPDFPNVPQHVANPENPRVFDAIIERGQQVGADLILASDPDADRMGAAAPRSADPAGPWATLTGNQLSVLLADYVLDQRQRRGSLQSSHYVVTTLVTTRMLKRLTESYGTRCFDDNLVGFKWIGSAIDREGPEGFVFGTEESHGYLAGTHVRDKDGAVACLLMCELAAQCKQDGRTLFDKLDQLYLQHGYHAERLLTITMAGSDGMRRMQALMEQLRGGGPARLGELTVAAINDYQSLQRRMVGEPTAPRQAGSNQVALEQPQPFEGPVGDLVILDTDREGNYVAVRPSGTEPKVKLYLFTYVPPAEIGPLETTRQAMEKRLDAMEADLRAFADHVE